MRIQSVQTKPLASQTSSKARFGSLNLFNTQIRDLTRLSQFTVGFTASNNTPGSIAVQINDLVTRVLGLFPVVIGKTLTILKDGQPYDELDEALKAHLKQYGVIEKDS